MILNTGYENEVSHAAYDVALIQWTSGKGVRPACRKAWVRILAQVYNSHLMVQTTYPC